MYDKTVWIDHIADPNTGEVLQQGTRFDQQKMNNIENGIYDAHTSLHELEDAKVKEFAITLAADQWIGKTYPIQNPLLAANISGRLIMGVNTDQAFAELKAARISKSVVLTSGSLVITASGIVPTNNINLILQIKSTSNSEFIIDLPSDGGDADTLGQKEPSYFASKADYLKLLQRIEAAEQELEKKISKNMSMQFCLPLAGWDENNKQTLLCDKYKPQSNIVPMYMMPMSNVNACSMAGISIIDNTDTTITFECSSIPTTDLVVAVSYQGESDTWYEVLEELGEKEVVWYTKEMLPDPHVLLLINGEGETEEVGLSDKSKNKNVVANTFATTSKTIGVYGNSYLKGNTSLFPKEVKGNNDNIPLVKINTITNLDVTKPFQISGSFHLAYGSRNSYKDADFMKFVKLGMGVWINTSKNICIYYRDDTGNVRGQEIVKCELDDYRYPSHDFHIVMSYIQIDGVWNYKYNIEYYEDGSTRYYTTFSIPTKENTEDLSTLLQIGHYSSAYWAGSDENYTAIVADEIQLLDYVEDTHKFPSFTNKGADVLPETILTQVKHTKTIKVTDNTILRYNMDGTVDQYVEQTRVLQPYPDNVSRYVNLCHGEELTDSSLSPSYDKAIFRNLNVSSDIYKIGKGSYEFSRSKKSALRFSTIEYGRTDRAFTIDFWVYPLSFTYVSVLVSLKSYTSSDSRFKMELGTDGYLTMIDYGLNKKKKSSIVLEVNKWQHIALIKVDQKLELELRIDGISQGTLPLNLETSSDYQIWNVGCIGALEYPNAEFSYHFDGYIDEVRISKATETEFNPYISEKGWERL